MGGHEITAQNGPYPRVRAAAAGSFLSAAVTADQNSAFARNTRTGAYISLSRDDSVGLLYTTGARVKIMGRS